MAKSPLERQIESQMKQAKQLADKKRREDEKRAREQTDMIFTIQRIYLFRLQV